MKKNLSQNSKAVISQVMRVGLSVLLLGGDFSYAQAPQRDPVKGPQAMVMTGSPPYFVQNDGQVEHKNMAYYLSQNTMDVGFGQGRVYYNLLQWNKVECNDHGCGPHWRHVGGVLVEMDLGNPQAQPEAEESQPHYSNYFLGNDPKKWRTRVPHYGKVRYKEVYPGIDLVYFFKDGQLTYEFYVKPGGDPRQIAMKFHGADGLEIRDKKLMEVVTSLGNLKDGPLYSFQEENGKKFEVASAFVSRGQHAYGFEILEPYDASNVLVIDPTLTFSTYFGNLSGSHRTTAIDKDGNVYASGGASSPAWPTTTGSYNTSHNSPFTWPDVTAAKFGPDGKLLWSTFIGGTGEDYSYVSSVNAAGEFFISGRSGANFPTTPSAFQSVFGGGFPTGPHDATDSFVVRLSAGGDNLIYSTYIGGSGNDIGRGIHLLPTNEVIIGNEPSDSQGSPNLCAMSSLVSACQGVVKPKIGGDRDSFLTKLSEDGRTMVFFTYFGPDDERVWNAPKPIGAESIRAISVDTVGNIWIGGSTAGQDFSTTTGGRAGDDPFNTPNRFQLKRGSPASKTSLATVHEGYIAKLSPDAKKVLYFSWLGGGLYEEIETEGVADAAGNFYVVGYTGSDGSSNSTPFPTTPGAFQSAVLGTSTDPNFPYYGDAFLVKINENRSLAFATTYGGSATAEENFFGPVVDSAGNIYVSGKLFSNDTRLTTPDAYKVSHSGGSCSGKPCYDSLLAVFNPNLTGQAQLVYGTYYGGTGHDIGRHLAIHPNGSFVVLTGETGSTDIPITTGYQKSASGAYLARFNLSTVPADTLPPAEPKNLKFK